MARPQNLKVDATTASPREEGGLRVGALRLRAAQSSEPIERVARANPRRSRRADPKCPMCLFGLLAAVGATGLERALGLDPRVLLRISVVILAFVVVWFAVRRGLTEAYETGNIARPSSTDRRQSSRHLRASGVFASRR